MSRSFLTHPAVQRFLAAPGPVVLYGLLTGLFAWGSASAGWQSPGGFVLGSLALFSGLIVHDEVRYLATGRWPPGP